MMIELTAEHAAILERATKSGLSPEEVLNRAFAVVEDQLENEAWLLEHREAVEAHLAEGCAQAGRGELFTPEEAVNMLRERRSNRNVA